MRPVKPNYDDFSLEEDYLEAMEDYETALSRWEEAMEDDYDRKRHGDD